MVGRLYFAFLHTLGLDKLVLKVPIRETFRFGDGAEVETDEAYEFPAVLCARPMMIKSCVVLGSLSFVVGREFYESHLLEISYKRRSMTIGGNHAPLRSSIGTGTSVWTSTRSRSWPSAGPGDNQSWRHCRDRCVRGAPHRDARRRYTSAWQRCPALEEQCSPPGRPGAQNRPAVKAQAAAEALATSSHVRRLACTACSSTRWATPCSWCTQGVCAICNDTDSCPRCTDGRVDETLVFSHVQPQSWKHMKKGTDTQLKAGVRQAQACRDHNVRPGCIKQRFEAHVFNKARNSTARAMKRSRRTVLREYCCESDSVRCRIADRRGHETRRWTEGNSDLRTQRSVSLQRSRPKWSANSWPARTSACGSASLAHLGQGGRSSCNYTEALN